METTDEEEDVDSVRAELRATLARQETTLRTLTSLSDMAFANLIESRRTETEATQEKLASYRPLHTQMKIARTRWRNCRKKRERQRRRSEGQWRSSWWPEKRRLPSMMDLQEGRHNHANKVDTIILHILSCNFLFRPAAARSRGPCGGTGKSMAIPKVALSLRQGRRQSRRPT